jgi:hypothetical protein
MSASNTSPKHDGGAYGRTLLEGDPHWEVVKAVGFLYGDRDKKAPPLASRRWLPSSRAAGHGR